jgi:uncharacterized Zn finger protein
MDNQSTETNVLDERRRGTMAGEEQKLKCDTCGRETDTVSRVVVDAGYNRANARPLYNCPECYEKKLQERVEKSSTAGRTA